MERFSSYVYNNNDYNVCILHIQNWIALNHMCVYIPVTFNFRELTILVPKAVQVYTTLSSFLLHTEGCTVLPGLITITQCNVTSLPLHTLLGPVAG